MSVLMLGDLDVSHALARSAGRSTPVASQLSPFNGVTLYQLIARELVPCWQHRLTASSLSRHQRHHHRHLMAQQQINDKLRMRVR